MFGIRAALVQRLLISGLANLGPKRLDLSIWKSWKQVAQKRLWSFRPSQETFKKQLEMALNNVL